MSKKLICTVAQSDSFKWYTSYLLDGQIVEVTPTGFKELDVTKQRLEPKEYSISAKDIINQAFLQIEKEDSTMSCNEKKDYLSKEPAKFWMVLRFGSGGTREMHSTKEEAICEMERLSASNVGARFFLLESSEYRESKAVTSKGKCK